jgi:hypothetical protein
MKMAGIGQVQLLTAHTLALPPTLPWLLRFHPRMLHEYRLAQQPKDPPSEEGEEDRRRWFIGIFVKEDTEAEPSIFKPATSLHH